MGPRKMYAAISSLHLRPSRKFVLGLFLFQAIRTLVLWHASLSSWSTVSDFPAVSTGCGGLWHIPQSWIDNDGSAGGCNATQIIDIVDAAECALRLALINHAFMDHSHIPLISHQTSRSTDPNTWSSLVRKCVERWLMAATGADDPSTPEMAWLLWDDDGLSALVQRYEKGMYPAFLALPYPAERADAFRVLVLKWFGGIYGDIDSQPLKHPSSWIQASDLDDWTDERGNKHSQHQPSQLAYVNSDGAPASYTSRIEIPIAKMGSTNTTVNAVFGLEADNLPDPDDTYWRMGYTFPVQLTNWAMAMSAFRDPQKSPATLPLPSMCRNSSGE